MWWVLVPCAVFLPLIFWGVIVIRRQNRAMDRLRDFLQSDALSGTVPNEFRWLQGSASWELLRDAAIQQTRALRECRRRVSEGLFLRGLLEELHHGLIIVDEDMDLRYWNGHVKKLFPEGDWKEGGALIRAISDHRFLRLAEEVKHSSSRVESQFKVASEKSEPGSPGRTMMAEAAVFPTDLGGGVWILIHEVTEQLMAEQVRKDFVANASHELRTPLTLIQGYLENLSDGTISDAETVKHSYAVMEKHCHRILRIVEDMLTISRLESQNPGLRMEPFDFGACVSDAIEHVEQLFPDSVLRFEKQIPEGMKLTGDSFYWEQILINLFENAFKENSDRDIKVTIAAVPVQCGWKITVADNGIGIPRGELPFVFKRFYRVAKDHSRSRVKGTGLGLSIVKRAVEAHRGTIALSSIPGVETIFTITIPS